MRALLMHGDRDWDQEPALTRRFRSFRQAPPADLPRHDQALAQDLSLAIVWAAMGGDDEFLREAARRALLNGGHTDADTILYRQAVLQDCLKNPAAIRELYALAVEAIEAKRHYYISDYARHPGPILYTAIEALQKTFIPILRRLKAFAHAQSGRVESRGFTALFAMLEQELSEQYLATIQDHLQSLRFRQGVLVSAQLGEGNEGIDYRLHQTRNERQGWLAGWLGHRAPGYRFRIHERDEAGARALSELRDRGINLAANALAQSLDHIQSFFETLRAELAFYVACLNLRDKLASWGSPITFPQPEAAGTRALRFIGLYDVCLALASGRHVVGNAVHADGKDLVIITGANQGGKSTFLRSVGVAQIMMQCGMFVGAESFAGEVCVNLVTHYKREEDAALKSGKLDEELVRMSEIAEAIRPRAMLLCNESFASTNEREGSEIARQVVSALLERRVRVFFVTHLYEFAHGVFHRNRDDVLFLRAQREADGTRTFKLMEGEPQQTSYGEDLYRQVFGLDDETRQGCS